MSINNMQPNSTEQGEQRSPQFYNSRVRGTIMALCIALAVAPVVLPPILLDAFAPHSPHRALFSLLGLGVGIAMGLLIQAYGSFVFTSWLLPRLRSKIESDYKIDLADAWAAGFTPGDRLYGGGGETSWDNGFAIFQPGTMRYYGELTWFELRADQVESIVPYGTIKRLGLKFPKFLFTWHLNPGDAPQTFVLEWADARSFEECQRSAVEGLKFLENWRTDGASGPLGSAEISQPVQAVKPVALKTYGKVGWLAWLVASVVAMASYIVLLMFTIAFKGRESLNNPLARLSLLLLTLVILNVLARKIQNWMDRT